MRRAPATGSAAEVEAAIRRLSCVQLDSISAVERSHRIALASRVGAYKPGIVPRLLGQRPRVRVLGARGVPASRRGVAALRRPDARRRPALVRGRRRDPSAPRGRDPGRDPRPRPARLAPLRGSERRRRDVELEAGEGDARPPLEPRRPRDRGPAGIPAALRPAGAGDSEGDPRRPGPDRRGAPACARREGRRRAWRAHRVRDRRALAAPGWHQAHPPRRRRARRRRGARAGRRRRRRRAGDRAGRRGARSRRALGGGAAVAVRQPPLGPPVRPARARLRPPDRGLQEGARAPLRLLRPAVPLARPHRRPRRPEVGAGGRGARREGVPSRAGRPRLGGSRRRLRPRARPAPACVRARARVRRV